MLGEWHPRYSTHFAVIHRGLSVSVRGTLIRDPRIRRFTGDKGMALHSAVTTDAEGLPSRSVWQYSADGTEVTMRDRSGLLVTETRGTNHIACRYGGGPEVQVHPSVSREIIHAVAYAEMLSAIL